MSVLSDLFQNIADAIRTKTGDTAAMAPASFPDNILSIVTGGNSGDSSINLQYATGSVKPTSTTATVSHGMGVVPDIVCVFANHIPADKKIILSLGFSTAAHEKFGLDEYASKTYACYSTSSMTFSNTNGMEEAASSNDDFGHVRNVTVSTFTFGGTGNITAYSGKQYQWFAIAGLT